jgi:hypothetical protein
MLSNPSAESSPGSIEAASIGRSSRSRMAFSYSVRLRRGSTRVPGSGAAAACRSSTDSMWPARRSKVARSGRGAPAGGIMPVRSLRTAFSHSTGFAPARSTLRLASDIPPAFSRSLWQVAQYCSITCCGGAGCRGALLTCGWARPCAPVRSRQNATTNPATLTVAPPASRATRSWPACARRPPPPGRRLPPSARRCVLPCPSRRAARPSWPAAR